MDFISDPDMYYNLVGRTTITAYCTLSAVMIFLWDWMIHLDDEVNLIWWQDWNLAGKPLYLFLRYGGLAFQVYDLVSMLGSWDQRFCKIYFWALPCGTAVLLYVVDVLLSYRVVCLYRCNRTIMYINGAILIISMIAPIIVLSLALPLYKAIATPEYLTGCWAWMPHWAFASTIPPIAFELWMFSLVVWKVHSYYREFNTMPKMNIMKLLIRDQLIWFVVIAAAIMWNLLLLAFAPLGLRALALPFFRSAVCICGCHLVLHIRQAYFATYKGGGQPSSEDVDTVGAVVHVYAPKIGLPPATKRLQSIWFDEENEGDRRGWHWITAHTFRRHRRQDPSAMVVRVAQQTVVHVDDGEATSGTSADGVTRLEATPGEIEMACWDETWNRLPMSSAGVVRGSNPKV